MTRSSKALVGAKAGHVDYTGYRRIRCEGRVYSAHHLVWLWHYGYLPDEPVDHIDHNRDNNLVSNLRLVTPTEQMQNRSTPCHNTSGVMGVSYLSKKNRYQVTIEKRYYGMFKTIEEATSKAKEVYSSLGYHPNHGCSKE